MISTAIMVVAVLIGAKPAFAELRYNLSGWDSLNVGNPSIRSLISYDGEETIRIAHSQGAPLRMGVDAVYRVSDGNTITAAQAHAAGDLTPDGGGDPPVAQDPAYLTLLTQPFAILLDSETIHDVDHLTAPIPFHSLSPLTGSELRGTLTRGIPGIVAGWPVVVLRFTAEGPIRGSLPYNDQLRLSGSVHMDGVACYRRTDGLLLSLNTILDIDGRVGDDGSGAPVSVAYRRNIRAVGQAQPNIHAEGHKK